jgi:hypothetical protein
VYSGVNEHVGSRPYAPLAIGAPPAAQGFPIWHTWASVERYSANRCVHRITAIDDRRHYEWWSVFCFAEREHAEKFKERFGGEWFDPKRRGR